MSPLRRAMMPLAFIVVLLATLLGGCSVSREEAREHFSQARACCESLDTLPYPPLPPDEVVLIDLNEKAPAFHFPDGMSYFAAFRLPPFSASYPITVKSFALGEHIDVAHIFYPELWLLDENFVVLGRSDAQLFVLSQTLVSEAARENKWGLPVKLQGTLQIDDPRAAYLVILTTETLLNGSSRYGLRRAIPVVLPGLVTALPGPRDTVRIPHSPFGRISVQMDGPFEP